MAEGGGKIKKKSVANVAAVSKVTPVKKADIDALILKAGKSAEKVSTVLFHSLMKFAHTSRASDMHLEALEEKAVVRYRIDGILRDVFVIPSKVHDRIIGLIKILTHMRTDEHRSAQDGRYSFESSLGEVDVRVSVMPFIYGEKAVLRLLSSQSHKLTLEQLGFLPKDLEKVQQAIHKSWGMILSTGPTGSGKTTTTYAILEILNQRQINISTIEDPVEFYIPGVNQSQVNRTADLTFANGLRALMRQDPDVIMVGEIRDQETAKIGINAALTGHKLLSTLHTNNAATTIPRLIDMGVEPFLVASTLLVAVAQRLLRRVCSTCVKTKTLSKSEATKFLLPEMEEELFKKKSKVEIAEAVGCKVCGNSGYHGRVGIYEVLSVSDAIKELIVKRGSSEEIEQLARQEGMTSMMQDGVQKVLQQDTTIEELLRVMQD